MNVETSKYEGSLIRGRCNVSFGFSNSIMKVYFIDLLKLADICTDVKNRINKQGFMDKLRKNLRLNDRIKLKFHLLV